MLDKNNNKRHFKTTVVYIFPKNVHCDMIFLDVKMGALRFWYCCSGIYILETFNSVINCIIIVPNCGLPKVTKLYNFMNYS